MDSAATNCCVTSNTPIAYCCTCGCEPNVYRRYIKGVANVKHWFITCKNCDKVTETVKLDRGVVLWNQANTK